MVNLSAATFIRNNDDAGFCLWESMASLLPFVEDMTILDCGSTDGTLQRLEDISSQNKRIRVIRTSFSVQDAKAFADIANACVASWQNNVGIFWQADEIWHEHLLGMMAKQIADGAEDLAFWRYQLKENWQEMKWPPHPVHRLGPKDNFVFVQDGMNTSRTFGVNCCSTYNMGWFIRWGDEFKGRYPVLPTHEMILDVSANGGFIDNIVRKRRLHAPMWHEQPHIDGVPIEDWVARQRSNPNWGKQDTLFDIPTIMAYHLGKPTYTVRDELINALRSDDIETIWRMTGYADEYANFVA